MWLRCGLIFPSHVSDKVPEGEEKVCVYVCLQDCVFKLDVTQRTRCETAAVCAPSQGIKERDVHFRIFSDHIRVCQQIAT